ncbi:hypothetical protein B0O80DRAFT_423581 [Mortierella sp. GBAus27b]|nr:hypothetical protein B0O80DRAFT_423581 [Mortierella sp. GBAus27b]
MGILDGLTTRQTLELANFHLEYARKTSDNKLALAMCNYAESALVTARRNARWARKYSNDQALREGIAQSYFELAKLQAHLDRADKARGSLREAERWSSPEP